MKRSGVLPIGWLIRSLNRRYKQKSVSISALYTFGAVLSQTTENTAKTRVDDNLSDLTCYLLSDTTSGSGDSGQHYQQLPEIHTALPFRFLARIAFRADGCWIWTGGVRHKAYGGYPAFNIHTNSSKDIVGAHRYSYEAHNGPIAPGLEIDHLCCNKLCVNPAHLEAVTHKENMARWSVRRRELRAKASLQETRVIQ